MIRFRNVTKTFPRTGAAISNVSFHIRKGEFAFLTGHSGAGKSTLLNLIHFQTRPDEGDVQVSRYRASKVRRRDIPDLRRRVGFVFQDFKLLDRMTAAENVAFALEVTGTPRKKIDGKVQRLLSQVGLAAKAKSLPTELSGGERQRVVIARALATDPLVLLADEPTGNLDPRAADGVFQLFRTLNQLGMAILMATHDTELVRRNPDMRVLELERGKLVYDSVTAPVADQAAQEAVAPASAADRAVAPEVASEPAAAPATPRDPTATDDAGPTSEATTTQPRAPQPEPSADAADDVSTPKEPSITTAPEGSR